MAVTIASLYFQDLEAERAYKPAGVKTGYNYHFRLPAAKDGVPSLLVVHPMYSHEYTVMEKYNQQLVGEDRKDGKSPEYEVAEDLVNFWSRNMADSQYGHPAVWICEGPEPTPEEIATNKEIQARWCKGATDRVQGQWLIGKRDHATELNKAQARYIGRGDYEWVREPVAIRMVPCPFCRQPISSEAPVCSHCRRVANPKLLKEIEARLAKELPEIQADLNALQDEIRAENPNVDFRDPQEILAEA